MWHIEEFLEAVDSKKKELTEAGFSRENCLQEMRELYLFTIAKSLANIADSLEEINGYNLSDNKYKELSN